MQTTKESLMKLFAHVSNHGWDKCTWTDESLSTKKLYPGHQFAAKARSWQPRIRTDQESMDLTIQRLQFMFDKGPIFLRHKVNAERVSQISERACVVRSLAKEIRQRVPLSEDIVEKSWTMAWAEGVTP